MEKPDCHDMSDSVYVGAYAVKAFGSNGSPTDWVADLTVATFDSTETRTARVIPKNSHDMVISD